MRRIEDYALIGDCESAALVGRDGSIDWLCWPSFDSDPCFAALVGEPGNGRWRVAPAEDVHEIQRRYLPQSLVLETRFRTASGVLVLTDFMPLRGEAPDIVRMLRCESGRVRVRSELALRFDYGRIRPWLTLEGQGATAVAGPHAVRLAARVPLQDQGGDCIAEFALAAGEETAFVLTHFDSPDDAPDEVEPEVALKATLEHWRDWVDGCRYEGPWREAVVRSLITLKALTFAPTGGVLAALTTSLPEDPKGGRTWDYRYCWLRDATFTLMSLLYAGYTREARAWRGWLLRAVAGSPAEIQPVYTVRGERRIAEWEAPWLTGFRGGGPVRFGNAAANQWQLDVLGEVVDALYQATRHGVPLGETEQRLIPDLVAQVERCWREPDHGLWETRGEPRRFTHSQVMAWVAVDRAIKLAERLPDDVPLARWRKLRTRIHEEVCRDCYDAEQGCFTQAAGSSLLDAGVLLIPHVGFLPAHDPRMVRTVSAIRDTLMRDGLVHRYDARDVEDGLGGQESPFLACTFWLADALILQGRREEGREIFERLLALRNDVGLLSEEYDPVRGLMGGNFPQALSHLSLVNTAFNLQGAGPAHARGDGAAPQPAPETQEEEPCLAPR